MVGSTACFEKSNSTLYNIFLAGRLQEDNRGVVLFSQAMEQGYNSVCEEWSKNPAHPSRFQAYFYCISTPEWFSVLLFKLLKIKGKG